MKARVPFNEAERLAALRDYKILDTLPEACYDDIVLLASEICATPIAAVSLVDEERQWFKAKVGLEATETSRDMAFCAHAILQPEILVVPDAQRDERFADNPLVTGEPWIRFYAGVPLVARTGVALGSLCVIDQVQRTLTEQQTRSLNALSRQVMAQLELRRHIDLQEHNQQLLEAYQERIEGANAQLHALSLADDVTGFHNTRFLHQHLDRFFRGGGKRKEMSLVFFDMDRFKSVVDTHGHLLGAKVLREVARVVGRQLDADDRIVRYGGDEFVVILPHQGREEARAKTARIREAINATRFLRRDNLDVRVSASFGIASFPADAKSKKQLLLAADDCLFRSKKAGRNRISEARAGQDPAENAVRQARR